MCLYMLENVGGGGGGDGGSRAQISTPKSQVINIGLFKSINVGLGALTTCTVIHSWAREIY